MSTKTFVCTINTEGPNDIKRAKVPTGLINQMGGEKGDGIEFTVTGKTLTGARIVRAGKKMEEAKKLSDNQGARGANFAKAAQPKAQVKPQPAGKVAPKVKPQVKPAPAQPAVKPKAGKATPKSTVPLVRPQVKPKAAGSAAKIAPKLKPKK